MTQTHIIMSSKRDYYTLISDFYNSHNDGLAKRIQVVMKAVSTLSKEQLIPFLSHAIGSCCSDSRQVSYILSVVDIDFHQELAEFIIKDGANTEVQREFSINAVLDTYLNTDVCELINVAKGTPIEYYLMKRLSEMLDGLTNYDMYVSMFDKNSRLQLRTLIVRSAVSSLPRDKVLPFLSHVIYSYVRVSFNKYSYSLLKDNRLNDLDRILREIEIDSGRELIEFILNGESIKKQDRILCVGALLRSYPNIDTKDISCSSTELEAFHLRDVLMDRCSATNKVEKCLVESISEYINDNFQEKCQEYRPAVPVGYKHMHIYRSLLPATNGFDDDSRETSIIEEDEILRRHYLFIGACNIIRKQQTSH